jgi:BirA family biotin operon repressor/biotin-[acetyl-CoA-carboxylase] ligase
MPADSLACAVRHLPVGWSGHYSDVVESTQDQARVAAGEGAPNRSVFVADCQSAGRGRQGRTWSAAPGTALLMSMLFRETAPAPRPFRYTRVLSLAVLESVLELIPGALMAIKWPNDLMLADRKVAGILAETAWNGEDLQVIAGLGVNISSHPNLPQATSLGTVGPIDRGRLLGLILASVDRWLTRPDAAVHAAWANHLWARGQRLRLLDLGEQFDVVVLGADDDGSLHVRLSDGQELHTTTGELLA